MTELAGKATTLLELHQPGNPVILPTVWDAWSANLAISAGFTALTVGSHPVSDSIGKPDNEGITFEELTTRIRRSPRRSTSRSPSTSSPATGRTRRRSSTA